ncbi:hypothetical protein PR048_012130 [Dryococelus australis]|uniref:CCHC-type domain-containing protein n=1 Tax=Dryococelus australis TaxID=614101 RepID=A0ABQ9HP52_9NEOP|nr:hypothetical protein PR048_012130 [Dryococelus australis]
MCYGKDRRENALFYKRQCRLNWSKCFNCGEPGHLRANYFNNKPKTDHIGGRSLCLYCKKLGHVIKDYGVRINVNTFISAAILSESVDCQRWYIDSGASEHMCAQRSIFSNFSMLDDEKQIMISDGSMLVTNEYELKLTMGAFGRFPR